jgi:hypothetical protein
MLDAFLVRGIRLVVVLGDFGFLWKVEERGQEDLQRLTDHLRDHSQVLLWVDGNHENFTALHQYSVVSEGIRWITESLGHLPRGYRTSLANGMTLAALGGANSIDFEIRTLGKSWWFEEAITDDDLIVLGDEHADILLAHDAPLDVPKLDNYLVRTASSWTPDGVFYAEVGRQNFHRGFMQVKPSFQFGGHYHRSVDQTVHYGDGDDAFDCRVVILDCDHAYHQVGAIFRIADQHIAFLDADGLESRR